MTWVGFGIGTNAKAVKLPVVEKGIFGKRNVRSISSMREKCSLGTIDNAYRQVARDR